MEQLTKREQIATSVLQGMVTGRAYEKVIKESGIAEKKGKIIEQVICEYAVEYADMLLSELRKKDQGVR